MERAPPAGNVVLKRIYDRPAEADGVRVLVDRLWPRGLRKEAARTDLWMKDLAPSRDLRLWFGHDAARWPEFRQRYRQELAAKTEALAALRALARHRRVTLLYAAADGRRNNAAVLRAAVLMRPVAPLPVMPSRRQPSPEVSGAAYAVSPDAGRVPAPTPPPSPRR
ncbi:MAG: DUF488 family protein [Rhodospirillales bacterium]|nr:DUF488 family protein [Rhodospirillales bacterium]